MKELISCLHKVAAVNQRVEHENRLVNRYTARDFTPFRFISWSEVPSTHMLAFFLDPDEDHGQGPIFQELFIEELQKLLPAGIQLPKTRWLVEPERRHTDYGQLDLLLSSADRTFGICLENKPRDQTRDQPRQLTSYRELLLHRHQQRYLLLYLSREKREPSHDSLDPKLLQELTADGHYLNLTYRNFILALLDSWYQNVHPESLRIFLRQFRHQVEQWLQFESTKPAQLMQDQEIAATLASSPAYVQTAFDIQGALSALRAQLLDQLSKSLTARATGLIGDSHWKDIGFLNTTPAKPFLLRRPSPNGSPQSLPWGRYAIGLEFDGKRLFYGIRFDKANWYQDDTTAEESWSPEAPTAFGTLLGTGARPWSWWVWWDWVGPETDQDLYPKIAEGKVLEELVSKIGSLTTALDSYCGSS
ncbi:PD-(D/E)XK nuclease family protein [Hymenobacter bucti]|uniref:PD-(D/E)XK nuclease family protein n=1 Tax=Hymenobacter bucti TaxID=1844114 RepID=A0ABW4QY38_9BACT